MNKPTSVDTLNKLGRVQLSPNFFMRDMLYSEIANFHGIPNIPDNPDLAIEAGRRLCNELLEPLRATFGHVSIRSAYRSRELNKRGNDEMKAGRKGYSCALDNDARHTWDRLDRHGLMGATACIVIPWFARLYKQGTPWQAMAWWIHDRRDRLPYSELCFYPIYAAFNIRWYAGEPEHTIRSFMRPRLLTRSGCEDRSMDHSSEYPGFPELILP